jgi:hypothetical protein
MIEADSRTRQPAATREWAWATMRRAAAMIPAVLLAVVLAAVAILVAWLRLRDPVAALPREEARDLPSTRNE